VCRREQWLPTIEAGIEAASVHTELTQLFIDYCLSDVTDFIDLDRSLCGSRLGDTCRRTAADIA
jgi:hypothetical protein